MVVTSSGVGTCANGDSGPGAGVVLAYIRHSGILRADTGAFAPLRLYPQTACHLASSFLSPQRVHSWFLASQCVAPWEAQTTSATRPTP